MRGVDEAHRAREEDRNAARDRQRAGARAGEKLRHHLGGRRGAEHRGADAILPQQLTEHLRGQRVKITLRAGDHGAAAARRLARLAHKRVQRGRGDPGGEMLIGRGELVAIPALADFVLSRRQQVHDDLLPGDTPVKQVKREPDRRPPVAGDSVAEVTLDVLTRRPVTGGLAGRGPDPLVAAGLLGLVKGLVGQAHRLVGIACRRGDTRREGNRRRPFGQPFGAQPMEKGIRVPGGTEDDEELLTAESPGGVAASERCRAARCRTRAAPHRRPRARNCR